MMSSVPPETAKADYQLLPPAVRGWIVRRGLLIAGVGVAMALILTIVAGLAIISGAYLVLQAILGPSVGPPPPSTAASGGIPTAQLLNGFLAIFGFFFFTSNGVPYHLGLGTSDFSISGVGALVIVLVVIVLSFASGRALARRHPSASLAQSMVHSALLAVPYWTFGLVLFVASTVHGDLGLFGTISAGPTWPGLALPLLVVALPAMAGSTIGHATFVSARGLTRGAGFGMLAVLLGVIGTLVGAVIAGTVNAFTGSAQKTPFGNALPSGSKSTPVSSSNGAGVLFLGAAVVVGP